ncbi:MAG TPA: aspartate/glutamate racemase family protein, partial [Chitinophagaceae bacterium]|nr:aspartate/glutamate racemase family protein [Chitinophagaceae bacterium]
ASAKALRTIQQKDLPVMAPQKRVLGVIRPTAEMIGHLTENQSIGILATAGTVASDSYPMEIKKFFPEVKVYQEACPMWVPLVENGEAESQGADYFIRKNLESLFEKGKNIDAVLLGCTHYPLLIPKIKEYLPVAAKLLSQGEIVAKSLVNYLERHPEMANLCSRQSRSLFFTTDDCENFDRHAEKFYGQPVQSAHTDLKTP